MDNAPGKKLKTIAEKFQIAPQTLIQIAPQTLSTILKDKKKYLQQYEDDTFCSTKRRARPAVQADIDEALLRWFMMTRASAVPRLIRQTPITSPFCRPRPALLFILT